jgi:hypothetical protein
MHGPSVHLAKAPTSRRSSGAFYRGSVISLLFGQSHIVYAAWPGRSFMREPATSNKASSQNQSFSYIGRNTSPSNCASSATTSKSLRPTMLQHRTPASHPEEVIFDGVAGNSGMSGTLAVYRSVIVVLGSHAHSSLPRVDACVCADLCKMWKRRLLLPRATVGRTGGTIISANSLSPHHRSLPAFPRSCRHRAAVQSD